MLKQTVTYTDFNDEQQTETLHFNVSKTELMEHLDLKDDLDAVAEKLQAKDGSSILSPDEVREILNLVKRFIRISYGVRSADGKRFSKSEDVWSEFEESAAYDAFLFSLFEDPQRAVDFMTGILPKDLREEVEKHANGDTENQLPAWVVEGRQPSPEELAEFRKSK